jgi:hypothetical protein
MKSPQEKTEISLHIPPQMWHQFKQAMLATRTQQEEVIGFFFCERHQVSQRKIRYLATTWVVPSTDCYESQSAVGIVLKQEFHLYLLNNYLRHTKLHIVHIHTHPYRENLCFSSIDDHYESEYARFLSSSFSTKPRLISGVFDSEMQHYQFRLWNRKGDSFQSLKFCHSWFEVFQGEIPESCPELIFNRQLIFGNSFQAQLGSLTVALIGCGGIGAIFAEILGRLGVKKWLLIDPDHLETVNLNRMPAATSKMVEQQWYKVHYVKRLIKGIYATGSQVKALPTSVEDISISREIAKCDLIVVATDNHFSRQIAQEIALEYVRPLMCLGTHIELTSPPAPLLQGEGRMISPPEGQIIPPPEGRIIPPPEGRIIPPPEGQIIPPPEGQIIPPPEGQIIPSPEGRIILPPEGQIIPPPEGRIIPPPEGRIIPSPEGRIIPPFPRREGGLGGLGQISQPHNIPRMYCRITIPPLGGGWCLMCGNIINLQQAALEAAPSQINQMAAQRGYLEGIDNPAVFWLNSICASTAVGIIHGMVSGFLNLDDGLDWIYTFPESHWLKTDVEHLATPDCYFCSP